MPTQARLRLRGSSCPTGKRKPQKAHRPAPPADPYAKWSPHLEALCNAAMQRDSEVITPEESPEESPERTALERTALEQRQPPSAPTRNQQRTAGCSIPRAARRSHLDFEAQLHGSEPSPHDTAWDKAPLTPRTTGGCIARAARFPKDPCIPDMHVRSDMRCRSETSSLTFGRTKLGRVASK